MKQIFKILLATWVLAISLPVFADADAAKMPPDTSSPELQRIKSLEGRWTTVTSMFGEKDQRMYTEYEVTAGGSAVLERIFPGTPYEMVSLYYDDNKGKLAMTHYCIMRNRPTLKLASSTDDSLILHVDKVEGLKSKKDERMGDLKITFKDKDHIETTCNGNKKDSEPMTMEYTRVK